MRVKADINSDRIAQLEDSTSIKVIGETGNWYKIQWANSTGYMMKKYLEEVKTARAERNTPYGKASIWYDNTDKLKMEIVVPSCFSGHLTIDDMEGKYILDGKALQIEKGFDIVLGKGLHTLIEN